MRKILHITDEIEKILIDVFDVYLKGRGFQGNPVVNALVSSIKTEEENLLPLPKEGEHGNS